MRKANDQPFHIVVGFDFSEFSKLALAEALGLASLNERTVLHILGVLDDSSGLGPVVAETKVDYRTAEAVQAEIKKVVETKLEKYRPSDFQFFIHARLGTPAEEILTLADEVDADLVVVGTHGRSGLERLFMGSVAERVVRHARCPVLVMRSKPATEEGDDEAESDEAYQPEPACPQCVVRRLETDGREWWCDEHAGSYVQPHRYSYRSGIAQAPTGDDWSSFNK
ncbi:universal stress protein [Haliangium sp.]|uniref:universal stress protein n=1 Tax=Haliangium sp. TaxID=2663208 RepID=UPI003D13EB57